MGQQVFSKKKTLGETDQNQNEGRQSNGSVWPFFLLMLLLLLMAFKYFYSLLWWDPLGLNHNTHEGFRFRPF